MDEQREWPIYALANHDNGGRLLDLCRAHLLQAQADAASAPVAATPPNNRHTKHDSPANGPGTNTSGYQTTTSEEAQEADQGAVAGPLEWRHLIQVAPPAASAQPLERQHQVQVVKLAGKVRKLLSPFVSNECHINNEPAAPVQLEPGALLAAGGGPQNAHRPANREAQLRRLSWRKRRQLERRTQSGSEDRAGKSAASTNRQRHLAKSFSFERPEEGPVLHSNERARSRSGPRAPKVRGTRLERWLGPPPASCPESPFLEGGWPRRAREARGRYGESIVHVLLINHTNHHLVLLLIVLNIWPALLFDVFESRKFKHLNCLHLAISCENADLLAYLIDLARSHDAARGQLLIEQRVSGSLFRAPPLAKPDDSTGSEVAAGAPAKRAKGRWWPLGGEAKVFARAPTGSAQEFWCDRLAHWPTADGARHLILLDRLKLRASAQVDSAGSAGKSAAAGGTPPTSAIYFGQTPLAWSLSFRSRSMLELLLERGRALVNSTDSAGNNGLHQVVINNQLGCTRALIKRGMSLEARNALGLTPFLLACHLGRCVLFVELLELSALEFWCYSSVRCCGYPLESLDSILASSSPNRRLVEFGRGKGGAGANRKSPAGRQKEEKSAILVILKSRLTSDEQKSALLSTSVVKRLLEEKWKCFARRLFYRDLLIQLLQLLLMMAACFLRPARVQLASIEQQLGSKMQQLPKQQHFSKQLDSKQAILMAESEWPELARALWTSSRRRETLLRHLCELASFSVAGRRLWSFVAEWLRHRNLALQLTYNPVAANQALGNALLLACLPLRVARFALASAQSADAHASTLLLLDQVEDVLLIVGSPLLWSSLLFFVAAFYVSGPFVAIINYMLMRDLRQFSIIYLIFLYAFAQSIFYINHKPAGSQLLAALDEPANGTSSTPANGTLAAGLTSLRELEAVASWLWELTLAYLDLLLDLFKMTLAVYEFQYFRRSALSRLSITLFLHLIPILFNMLLAMMNNTYSLIISQSERAWSIQWATTLFALERRLDDRQRLFYLKKYAINLSSSIKSTTGDEDENSHENGTDEQGKEVEPKEQFVPGLMIIKRTNCTRAEMRRKLIGYWQKSIRQILNSLKRKQRKRQT